MDLIERQVAIRKLKRMATQAYIDKLNGSAETVINCCIDVIERQIPSAEPEIKPISYQDCANAMMMMWIDDVLTDGEYRRIMDKLNDHESRRENR